MPIRKPLVFTIQVPEQEHHKTFTVYPSAHGLIRHWVSRAQEKGTIEPSDATFCEAALTSAAVLKAHERGSSTVLAADVAQGWSGLRAYGLCVPAFHCMQRSIVSRADELKTSLPMLSDIFERIR